MNLIPVKKAKTGFALFGVASAIYFIGLGNILCIGAAGSVIYYCIKNKK